MCMSRIWRTRCRRRRRRVAAEGVSELQRSAGRQRHSSRVDCDAGALARADGAGCDCGRERHLCREAALPYAGRRRGAGESGEEIEERDSGGHAAAELRPVSQCAKDCGGGSLGKVRMVRSWWLNNSLGACAGAAVGWQIGLGTMAGSGGTQATGSGPVSQLARVFGIFGRHCGGPRGACFRRNSFVDECELSAGGECVGGACA